MRATEADIERAEALVAKETAASIARAEAAVAGSGAKDCIDCGETIDAARRRAAPFARRCIACQTSHERHSRGL